MQPSAKFAHDADGSLAQAERVCGAIVELVTEHGYEPVTAAMIRRRAEIGEADFEQRFDDKEACCIAAFERIADAFRDQVMAAFEADQRWRDALRASAYAAARFIRDNQRDARFGALELLRAGSQVQSRREASLQRYVDLIDAGRTQLADPDSLSRSTAEAVVGSIVGLLVKRISTAGLDEIESLVPELMYIAVRPYLGEGAAREELAIPPPPEQRGTQDNGEGEGRAGRPR